MIYFDNGGRLVQSIDELPDLTNSEILFADFETSSGDSRLTSTNPWRDCYAAGIGVTVDEARGAWYVPAHLALSHNGAPGWWERTLYSTRKWVNHNIKYDAHVSANCMGVMPPKNVPLHCTLTSAKIIDSDRLHKGGYGLDKLSQHWLRENISVFEDRMHPYLAGAPGGGNKDFGRVPYDIIGEYGCQDVMTNRRLLRYEERMCPEECRRVWDTEVELTRVLFDMERVGMRVIPDELRAQELLAMTKMCVLEERLARLVGRTFDPSSNTDVFEILCNQYGLPILAWTQEDEETGEPSGNPSFDKHAMIQYALHPYAPAAVVAGIQQYRKLKTKITFFLRPYQELATHEDDGTFRMHPTYNQAVRTGRMSCSKPNAQQLDEDAKSLVHPLEGESILSSDASQIEFRTICHYIRDEAAIAAFARDPDTDFHQWVADSAKMSRKPAKTLNFSMGFGQGRESTVIAISNCMEVVAPLKARVQRLVDEGTIPKDMAVTAFEKMCRAHAEKIYDDYHDTLPNLKRTSRRAAQAAKMRGYVRNIRGRHRHIPKDRSNIAFNTLNQSSAADMVKERMVALAKFLESEHEGVRFLAQVHDEIVLTGPTDLLESLDFQVKVTTLLESPDVELRVPLRWALGTSRRNWARASKRSATIKQCAGRLCDLGGRVRYRRVEA